MTVATAVGVTCLIVSVGVIVGLLFFIVKNRGQ